jgi:hypothetical protein
MPERIQRKRTKGWKMPPNTVNVTRPGKWGNPARIGMWRNFNREDAVRSFRGWITRDLSYRSYEITFGKPPTCEEIKRELGGKNLACFCPLDRPCHADVLLEMANSTVTSG